MVAGAITVIAIVLGFAGDVLGLPWHWMRPAAELLLLAELVGLVVLERHQLFEPVHESVGAVRAQVREIHAMMTESARFSGQVKPCVSTPEIIRTMTRLALEALARDHHAPQILRIGRLAGRLGAESSVGENPDLAAEFGEWINALMAYFLTPRKPARGESPTLVSALANHVYETPELRSECGAVRWSPARGEAIKCRNEGPGAPSGRVNAFARAYDRS